MAGRFLTLDEAARHLGVTVEEINRLVDRKQLFPMRDGANVKFKIEEIERVAADRGDAGDALGDLSLDLSSPSLAESGSLVGSGLGDDVLVLGDENEESDDDSIFGDLPAAANPSGTGATGGLAGSGPVAGDKGSALGSSDLELDSIIAASSSPSLPKIPTVGSDSLLGGSGALGGSGTLAIDLSNLGSGPAAGSGAGLSAPSLSDPLGTSGISLEGDDLAASGIDLAASGIGGVSGIGGPSGIGAMSGIGGVSGIGGAAASGIGGALAGDAFELGTDLGDTDSASVVMPVEESGDSSFFGTVGEESSQSLSTSGSIAATVGEDFVDGVVGPSFNAWQITGLVCTALLLLLSGFVMIDLVSSIRSPAGMPVSSPLLKALTDIFGWR
ncbi:MAG: helix-turn-helix domain-containing protein [Planctomycetota bacterium]